MEDDKSKHSTVNVSEVSEEESLQSKPHLQRHASAQSLLQTDDWWLWELAGILIALAALAGIGALLSVLADRPQPTWAYTSPAKKIGSISIPAVTIAVSPNTILSLLSTIGRICVLIPITKCLGQLKWVWFAERERQLSDFEAFDNAKSVTGSLILVWKLKFRHFAVVGAAAVLLALAFDPFVQNLLSYYSKNVEDVALPALLPRATEYVPQGTFFSEDQVTSLDIEMQAAIITGFIAGPNSAMPNYYCATGNCTWENTPTLGVCSRCADVSSMLRRSFNHTGFGGYRYSLHNGFYLDSRQELGAYTDAISTMNDDNDGTGVQPLVYANYTNPIARMWSIFADSSDVDQYTTGITLKTRMYATECILVPCVQVYSSTLGGNGVTTSFKERMVAEYDAYKHNGSSEADFTLTGDPVNSTGYWLAPSNDKIGNGTYHMPVASQIQLTNFLANTITGMAGSEGYLNSAANSGSLFMQFVFTADPAKTCNKALHSGNWESLRFQCAIENIARAITVKIRNIASTSIFGPNGSPKDGFETSPLSALGTTMVSKTYISVTWYWLILPIVLWILAVIMFVGTVWKTRKAGVRTWRTSTLAPLFLGLGIGDEQKQKVENLPITADGLQKKAEEIKVRLHLTEQDAKFVGG